MNTQGKEGGTPAPYPKFYPSASMELAAVGGI